MRVSFFISFSFVWGTIADAKGRKPVLIVSSILSAGMSVVFGFSVNFPMAVFTRFLAGLLNGKRIAMCIVSSPDHILYAGSKRGSDVIRQFSWACRATPPTWKHMINIHRWLEATTVLCTVNCKLRPTQENSSRQHWRWFSQDERECGIAKQLPWTSR